jgi:hypothetical protein
MVHTIIKLTSTINTLGDYEILLYTLVHYQLKLTH